MTAPGHLTIDLSPEAARLVRQAVTAGDYPDVTAAVEAAVHGWSAQRDHLFGYTTDELDRLIDDGIASGPGGQSLDEIQREGLRRAGVSSAEA